MNKLFIAMSAALADPFAVYHAASSLSVRLSPSCRVKARNRSQVQRANRRKASRRAKLR